MTPEVAAVHKNVATWLLLHSFILIFQVTLVVTAPAAATTPEPYVHHIRDNLNINLITMGCFEATSHRYMPAVFFLNGSTILYDHSNPVAEDDKRVIERVIPKDDIRITFVINKRAEGEFSCALRLGSDGNFIVTSGNVVLLVALPSPVSPSVSQPIFFAKVGSQARLNCPQKPGALVSKYFGKWKNSSEVLVDIQKPAFKVFQVPIPDLRYSIERSSFSLLIEDVLLSDSGSWYNCELMVENPQELSTQYSYEASMNLELLVYEPPIITIAPDSKVVSSTLVPNIVSFFCEAVGFAPPIITWSHLGKNVSSDQKYQINESYFAKGKGEYGTRSRLTLQTIDVLDTGPVQCLADAAPSVKTNHLQLPGDMSTTSLTVLGIFDSLVVFITTSQDVIFVLAYPIIFPVPVRLQLIYYEHGGEKGRVAQSVMVTTSLEYSNISQISYIATNNYVPFDKFQVEISLVYGSVVGPGGDTRLVYDKTSPSSCQSPSLKVFLLYGFLPIVIFILSSTVLIIVVIYCLNRKSVSYHNKNFKMLKGMDEYIRDIEKRKTGQTGGQDSAVTGQTGEQDTDITGKTGGQGTVVPDSCTDKSGKYNKMEMAQTYARVLKFITEYGRNDPIIKDYMYD